MILLKDIKIRLNDSEEELLKKVQKKLRSNEVFSYEIIRRSIDARKKDDILIVYQLAVKTNKDSKYIKRIKGVEKYEPRNYEIAYKERSKRIAVVGYGPAGIFASLCLQEAGFDVEVFERGEDVDTRQKDIDLFWSGGELNEESNVQFGEGGAGTFSDGKLTNRSDNPRNIKMFNEFVEAGAPHDILYVNNPHVGTDLLKGVIKNIRKKFIKLGGKIHFSTKVNEIIIEEGSCKGIKTTQNLYFDEVILAIGHSARDTFRKLYSQGVEIMQKPFAVGFRIEHLQSMINSCQFGDNYDHPRLGVAEYKLTHQTASKGVYTFCMSPGGIVVPAQSIKETIVVNGMSYHARNLTNANSAVLVTVDSTDVGDGVFAGLELQEKVERAAYVLGGSNYYAPVQTVVGYINDVVKPIKDVIPSYPIGYKNVNMRGLYPKKVEEAMIEGLTALNSKLTGFSNDDAILTGVETRSSSPIRIVRDKTTMVSNIENLYPIGEGCGYAGGIVSAAVDGIKVSEVIRGKYE